MGQSPRTYAFSSCLIGDLAPVMQLLLDNAIETKGPGLLIHPTIGATVVLGLPMPALAIAQRLYCDASRSDEVIARSSAIHPAFCPVRFQALTSGIGPNVNPTVVSPGT